MSSDNTAAAREILRRNITAVNNRDMNAYLANQHPDVEFVLPGGTTLRGREQVRALQSTRREGFGGMTGTARVSVVWGQSPGQLLRVCCGQFAPRSTGRRAQRRRIRRSPRNSPHTTATARSGPRAAARWPASVAERLRSW
jgi:hypothetical protein